MKRFITIFILFILATGSIWFYYHFLWVYGKGVKAGQLNYFNQKGYVFKTYEGKLIQAGFQGVETGGVQSNEFRFSVVNETVANKLMSNSGKEFELHYLEYKGTLPWRGVSEFVVDSIYSMRDSRVLPTPYTP
jgi:hypothetical protein